MAWGQVVTGDTVQSAVRTGSNQILRGHVVIKDNATVSTGGKRADAVNQAGVLGVSMMDDAGLDTEVPLATGGVVYAKNTSGATIAAGDAVGSHSSGGVAKCTALDKNIIGSAVEQGLANDLFPIRLVIHTQT